MDVPILLGHEGVGIVEKVGANCKRVKVGDHVVLSWMPSCGHCSSCFSGVMQLCDRGADLISGRVDGKQKIPTLDGVGVDQFSFLACFSQYVVVYEFDLLSKDYYGHALWPFQPCPVSPSIAEDVQGRNLEDGRVDHQGVQTGAD